MKKTAILIIILVGLLGFFNALDNGFVGDDQFIFLHNNFYQSWDNLPRLFSQDYLTDGANVFSNIGKESSSGSVAYRPVLSLTYFIDYSLWPLNPFGYHLTNVLIHLINSILVYILFFYVFKNNAMALLGALLFSIHPTKAEPVCAIGYRADVLSFLFVFIAFLSFLKFRNQGKLSFFSALSSIVFFFLAVFTKESAVVLPLLVMVYDRIFSFQNFKEQIKKSWLFYGCLMAVLLFYLFIYFVVFPNTSLPKLGWIGGSVGIHAVVACWIFCQYLIQLCLPFTVNLLPAQYVPSLHPAPLIKFDIMIAVAAGIIFFFVRVKNKNKAVFFGLLWFLICYLPVSNVIRIASPMAHRFLYLPSVGFAMIAAYYLIKLKEKLSTSQNSKLGTIICITIVCICLFATLPLNYHWNSNIAISKHWIKNYPNHQKAYAVLGLEYFKRGMFEEAKEVLLEAERLDSRSARIYYMLGIIFTVEPAKAEKYFYKSISLRGRYTAPYIGLGRLKFLQGEYEEAIIHLSKGMKIQATYAGYSYMIDSYLKLKDLEGALAALDEAKRSNLKDYYKQSLENKITVFQDAQAAESE